MSHVVVIRTRVHDPAAIDAACRRLDLAEPVQGTAKLSAGEATGLLLRLPGWQYPVVIDALTGSLPYDNYAGRWGDQARLDRFLQCYAVERCRIDIEARKKGYAVTEQQLADGGVKLTIAEGG
jgi:hypothetical protein